MIASVIISVRSDKRIVQCLESIFKFGINGFYSPFEVIVIENSREPLLMSEIKTFPVKYLLERRKGMGHARSKGISIAKGKYLVFTDADCIVSEGWLRKILVPFASSNVGIVGGPILKLQPQTYTEKVQRDLVLGCQYELQHLLPIYPKPYVVTANAAYRTSVVKKIGGIDSTFASGGDVDLAWRVGDVGYEANIAKDALVYHACRKSPGAVFLQFFRYSMGHAQLFKKVRHRTGKNFCVNTYPFNGCINAVSDLFKVLIAPQSWGGEKIAVGKILFQIIEYVALITGGLIGAIRTRTLYI